MAFFSYPEVSLHALAVSVGIPSDGARSFDVRKRARNFHVILTFETPVEVPVGEKKSATDESTPNWLTGLGSETLEQRLAFQNWMRSSLDDRHQEIIVRGWLPLIRGEHKEVH